MLTKGERRDQRRNRDRYGHKESGRGNFLLQEMIVRRSRDAEESRRRRDVRDEKAAACDFLDEDDADW